jgi:hypothetical protein
VSRPRDRIPAGPFLAWVAGEFPLVALNPTQHRAILRARSLGYLDFYMADSMCVRLGAPEMMRVLYPALEVAA